MKYPCILLFLLCLRFCFAQKEINPIEIDSLYKEDQFYIGVTYNRVTKKPQGVSQRDFSVGVHAGFIKDMPINKARNIAFAMGLGYSANSFNQNFLINKIDSKTYEYRVLVNNEVYEKNRFSTHVIEVPIELRWRTSTPTEYDFWRIYPGFKFGYVFANISKHKGELGLLKYKNNPAFNPFQYGLTLSAGYNTWNFHLYYALNPIFNSKAKFANKSLDMRIVKIGLMFYIL